MGANLYLRTVLSTVSCSPSLAPHPPAPCLLVPWCMDPACGYAHAAVIYILASMVQLTGPSHGAWFDPETMEPLYQVREGRTGFTARGFYVICQPILAAESLL
jgi:hypothetical protein